MRIRDCEYFEAVMRLGSIRGASKALHVSEPTISVQIRGLESELGVQLFSRSGRKLELTPEGEALAPSLLQVLVATNSAKASARDLQQPTGTIRIGVVPGHARLLVPLLIEICSARYPHRPLEITEGGSLDLERDILASRLDLAIVARAEGYSSVADNLAHIKLMRGGVVALLASDHPLARRRTLYASDLADQKLLLYRPGYIVHAVVTEMLNNTSVNQVLYNSDNGEATRYLVQKGVGIGFATDFELEHDSTETLASNGISKVSLSGAPAVDLDCVFFRGRLASRLLAEDLEARLAEIT